MEPGDKVRCINASGWDSAVLQEGRVYTVKAVYHDLITLYEIAMQQFRPDRFEVVETPNDEYAFFAAVPVGYCACNTPIDRCRYHG